MVASLSTLSETVDLSTVDRRLADEIQRRLPEIKENIKLHGYSVVVIDGKNFKITSVDEKENEVPVRAQKVG